MRLSNESFGTGDRSWLASSHGVYNGRTSTAKVSDFTAADAYPNGYFPAGLPVNAADEAALKPYTGAAGEVLGFVLDDRSVKDSAYVQLPILRHGSIRVHHLPVDFTAPDDAHFVFIEGTDA